MPPRLDKSGMRYTIDLHVMYYGYTCDADTQSPTDAVRVGNGTVPRTIMINIDGSFIKNKIAVIPDSL